ncbi:MAG TPA: helix-turn-helix domain-containing protein [Candidatus Limnocylindrales bacterium]|nr:helix-turn-helix domain-containing protein [Candidatus Limnocylindrales bacterium]
MDPIRLGRQARALRRRRGWRQSDLAISARVTRARVGRLERGHADELTLAALDAIARALGARLNVTLNWNGEALDRLLDADHASIVEVVATALRQLGWDVVAEVSFNVRGERGSIDILAHRPEAGVVLVVEVKTVIPDLQAMLFSLDRKQRLALEIAAERGWRGRAVGRILVVADSRTTRRRVAAHATTFDASFPARTLEVRRWLQRPDASRPFSGIWFLANDRQTSARQRVRREAQRARA